MRTIEVKVTFRCENCMRRESQYVTPSKANGALRDPVGCAQARLECDGWKMRRDYLGVWHHWCKDCEMRDTPEV